MTDGRFDFVEQVHLPRKVMRPLRTEKERFLMRVKKDWSFVVGLGLILMLLVLSIIGPMMSPYSYSDQHIEFKNLPPVLRVVNVQDNVNLFLSKDYHLFEVDNSGHLIKRLVRKGDESRVEEKRYSYNWNGEIVVLDYSMVGVADSVYDFSIEYRNLIVKDDTVKHMINRDHLMGTDSLGRDLMTRVMTGLGISMTIALAATGVNLIIGVLYGSIAGYVGGYVEQIMMRLVDVIHSIPLVLYVILVMVRFSNSDGIMVMILALSSVYWLGMARIVRGQILSIKEKEFVTAAKAGGISRKAIIFRHILPNTTGTIIVTLSMMVPSAIFTEAFISFIGLGVSAPMASLGTLANESLTGLATYPYQMIFPAVIIIVMILSFNLLGDGIRKGLNSQSGRRYDREY